MPMEEIEPLKKKRVKVLRPIMEYGEYLLANSQSSSPVTVPTQEERDAET